MEKSGIRTVKEEKKREENEQTLRVKTNTNTNSKTTKEKRIFAIKRRRIQRPRREERAVKLFLLSNNF